MKERVTITIDTGLLRTVDAAIDGADIRNRSQAIEHFIERGIKHALPARAVILAGGDPRILLKIVNGKAVIAHNIDLLTTYGIRDITVIADRRDSRVKDYLGDGAAFDCTLTVLEEREPMGTAGCLRLLGTLDEDIILTNGDDLKAVNLRDLYAFHKLNKGACTIALTNVPDPSGYGVAIMNGTHIVGFVEKPSGPNALRGPVSAGLYVLTPEALADLPKGYARLETDIFPKLAREDRLVGYPFGGQYLDIRPGVADTISDLWRGIVPPFRFP